MQKNLAQEVVVVLESQTAECKIFSAEILAEARRVNEKIDAMRTMLTNSHDDAKNKSFMKSGLKQYLSTIPRLDCDKLQSLLDKD